MNPVYTVGHSTRSADELVELLRDGEIEILVDVRRFPASRRHPWFNRDRLAATLEEAGIGYRHEEPLGGRRGPPDPASPNDGWRNEGFRAYADHIGSEEEARAALDRLEREAGERVQAVMCAEIVPWRCHRRIVSDHLVVRGLRVLHLVEPGEVREHELNEMARILDDGRVVYPPEDASQPDLFDRG